MTEQPERPTGILDIYRVEDPKLISRLCEDCVPIAVHKSKWGALDGGVVDVWATEHDPSCPWLKAQPLEDGRFIQHAPEQRVILLHTFGEPDEDGEPDVSE